MTALSAIPRLSDDVTPSDSSPGAYATGLTGRLEPSPASRIVLASSISRKGPQDMLDGFGGGLKTKWEGAE